MNIVLTGMAGFASARWYTFHQAKTLGGFVRKGEKGTQVVFWQFIDAKGGADDAEGDADAGKTRHRKIPLLKCYTVFNAEQIEWPTGSRHAVTEDAPDATDDDNYKHVEGVVAASGASISHQGVRAYYSPSKDRIVVPARSRFEDRSAYHATVLHELAHWTGGESRLHRDLTGRFGSESYAAEELVAEMAAAFLSADLGVEGHLQHAEYIGSWIKVLRSDKRAIFTAARLAQEAADYLIQTANTNEVADLQEAA